MKLPPKKLDYIMILSIPECNLFCEYCRKDDRKSEGVLTNEQLLEMARATREVGIKKVRWTGGEPTMRKGFVDLVAKVRDVGIEHQYLSTNATVLHRMAHDLREAGIERVNISLDTFDRDKFREVTGKDLLEDVLRSIEVAMEAFELVKINSVLVTGNVCDVHQFIDFVARFARKRPIPRFLPAGTCGAEPEEGSTVGALKPPEILAAFKKRYGEVTPFAKLESNNPHIEHYLIGVNEVVFGIVTPFPSQEPVDPRRFKTLRINPNGFVSNDLYSHDIRFLTDLAHGERVVALRELIEDKKTHDKAWYKMATKRPFKESIDFWRFGK